MVKVSSLGDMIHTLPAVTDAQKAIPGIRFDWVSEEAFIQIPGWHPAVDSVIPFALRRWKKHLFRGTTWQEWRAFRQLLGAKQYEHIIDAQSLLKTALMVSRLPIGPVHGLSWSSARESFSCLFYDVRHVIPRAEHTNVISITRKLLAQSLQYSLDEASPFDYGILPSFSEPLLKPSIPYVVCLHGTTWKAKHWPVTHWQQLLQYISQLNRSYRIKLCWGNAQEYARAVALADCCSQVEVLPQSDLASLGRLLMGATAVVTVDTGLGHLATALERPTVMLFGPTSAAQVSSRSHCYIPCTPDGGSRDLRNLSVEKVFNAIHPFL